MHFLWLYLYRRKQLTCCKRDEKFSCTEICCSFSQKIHFKDNIFVFHRISFYPMNCMKGSRCYYKNIPRFSLKAFCFDLDQPFSLFYINQFHLLMPVQRNRRKIQWNRTWINIKRKQPAAMLFCFLIFCTTFFFFHLFPPL